MRIGGLTTIIYVEKQLGVAPVATQCPKTPSWALTNIDTGKQRSPNNDVITIRVATTTDGINFTDIGAASGLQDPTSTAFDAIRWLGSGSIIPLSNGRYGLFFGAGNCLDNDSDGFHFIGYAETATAVNSPSDLLNWTLVYGFDNPILSTDTVTDPMGNTYPAHPPLINVTGADVLTPAQVSPWMPPTGYNTNFFSGRIYDPAGDLYRPLDRDHCVRRLQYAAAEFEPCGLPGRSTASRFGSRLATSPLIRTQTSEGREYVYPARAHLHHAAGVKQLLRRSAPTPPSPRHVTR